MKRKILIAVGVLVVLLTVVMVATAQANKPQEYVDALDAMQSAEASDFQSTLNEGILSDMEEYAESMGVGQASEIQEME